MAVLVRASRLRYFARVARTAPAALVALIRDTPSSHNCRFKEVLEAINWLRRFCNSVEELAPPDEDIRVWEEAARDHPQAWQA